MPLLVLFYLLVGFSGIGLVSLLRLRTILDNVLMALALGAAQLLVTVQLLSLFGMLTPTLLMGVNGLAAGLIGLTTRRRLGELVRTCREDSGQLRQLSGEVTKRPVVMAFLVVTILAVGAQSVIGWVMYPMTDVYHFAMPLFWRQNQSILPFPAYDPRLIAVVFGSEAMCLPGYLYANTADMFSVVSGLTAMLLVCLVAAMARGLGATVPAALCAGAMISGFGPMSIALLGAKADMLLSALWFGSSIHFLLRLRASQYDGVPHRLLGCSVFCFLMACGTKNTVLMVAPLYGACLWFMSGRGLLARRALATMSVAALLGLIASGVGWSYVNNLRWFGDARGPEYLKETLARDFKPSAVWTRLVRGTVIMMFDVIWLPASGQPLYSGWCRQTIGLLGGRDQLAEDEGFYSFRPEDLRPRNAFGPLASLMLVPSLLVAANYCWRRRGRTGPRAAVAAPLLLLGLTVGGFVIFHVLLRWQPIGIGRLMLPWLVTAVPLIALILERFWVRALGMVLLTGVLLVYSSFGGGIAARRLGGEDGAWLSRQLAKLQRSHAIHVDWEWQGAPAQQQEVKEGYTKRELVRYLLARLPQPTTFGLVGTNNAEGYYLFGDGFLNKVVSVSDSRAAHPIQPPAPEVAFVVAEDLAPEAVPPEAVRGFEWLARASHGGKTVLVLYQRKSKP